MKMISDQALSTAELFNFDSYAETIARTIVRKDTETPLVIGIFGDWGSGKTSLMRTIENTAETKFIFKDNIVNKISLANKLRDSQDQLSQSIKAGFSQDTQKLLEKYDDSASPSEELQKALVDELNEFINSYHFDKQKNYLFNWGKIPGNDNVKLIEFLMQNFSTEWIKAAEIIKNDDDKTIRLTNETNFLSLKLNDKKTNVNLEIDDGRTAEFIVKTENDELNIYQKKHTKKDNVSFSKEDLIRLNLSELQKAYSDEIDFPKTVKTIWFNAWKYDKEDVLWRALLMRILEELKTQKKKENEKFLPRSRIDKLKIKYLKLSWNLKHKLHPLIFHVNDLENRSLEAKLRDPENQLSQYLINNSNLAEILVNFDILETPREEMNLKLEKEINKFLSDNNLFKNIPFLMENSSNLMKTLIQSQPKGYKLKYLNKSLLEETYLEEKLDEVIEDLQTSLYRDVYREELGDLEFKPGKAIRGTIKLGLSAVPLIQGSANELLKNIDDHNALDDLLESVQKNKKVECIEQVQFMEQFQQKFEEIIEMHYNKNNTRVVIFIDDLDRCLPGKALEVLEAIKLFLDVKGCIFILGIDRRVINYIVHKKFEGLIEIRKEGVNKENHVVEKEREDIRITGENYLEKIIQLSFHLPPLTDKNINDLINDLVKKSNIPDFYAQQPYLYMIIKGIENNPRKIKRFFNVIELQRNLVASNKEIQEKITADEKIEKRFDALLLEWAIISYSYEKFQKTVNENNWILSEIHKLLLEDPDLDICESTPENLQNYLKWDKKECKQISELIKAFNKGIGETPTLKEIELVIHLSSVTPIEMPLKQKEVEKRERLGRNEVVIRKNSKESLRWKDISGVDLSGINLSDLDLSYSDFSGANLSNVNFNHAILTEANLSGAKLHRTNLKHANLSKADLSKAILKDTIMSNVNMSSADLSGADLYYVVFNESNMKKTLLTKARLVFCNFKNANFDRETNFKGAYINWFTIEHLGDSNWAIAQWDQYVLDQIKKTRGEEKI